MADQGAGALAGTAPRERFDDLVRALVRDLVRQPWVRLDARHYFDEYDEAQWLPVERAVAQQQAALRRLAWHCFLYVPYYARRFGVTLKPVDLDGLSDVTRLPIASIVERQAAREDFAVSDPRLTGPVAEQEEEARRTAVRLRAERWRAGPLLDWYGRAEVGLIAARCDRGQLHALSDHLLVEIVDEAAQPSPAGEEGWILVTALHDRTAPLLRYPTGDRGRLLDRACACGRTLPRFEVGAR